MDPEHVEKPENSGKVVLFFYDFIVPQTRNFTL
jgi:hypothetical protein